MPFLIWSKSFLIPKMFMLIPLPLQDSDGGVIPVQESLSNIHDILDNAVFNPVENTAHILASR